MIYIFVQEWIVKAYFKQWTKGAKYLRQEMENMMQLADSSYEKTLTSNCLKQWKDVSIKNNLQIPYKMAKYSDFPFIHYLAKVI